MENITLHINGKERIFSSQFIPTRILRNFLEAQTRIDMNAMSAEDLDEILTMLCNAYNNQFTLDELYDGLPSDKLQETLENFILAVNGGKKPDKPATARQKPKTNSTKK